MNQSAQESEPFDYSYYEYPDWYSNNAEPTKPPKEVVLPCFPIADDQIFHIVSLSLSLVALLVLAALSRKNRLCQGFTRGASCIFSPVNFLDQTQDKSLVLAVFGLVFSKLAVSLIAPDPLPFCRDTPPHLKEYLKIVSIFYYPLLYCPLLVCSTLQLCTGYVLGTALAFSHGSVLLWQKIDCPKTPELYKFYALLASLPQLFCLFFICLRFILLFIKGPEHDQDLDSSYYSEYVKELLKKQPTSSSSVSDEPGLMRRILDFPKSYIYVPDKVFRFPLKLAIGAFVSFVCIYHTALLLIILVVPTLHIVRAGIDENMFYLMMGFGIVLSDDRQETVRILIFYTWLLEVCYLCAMTLSIVVSLLMLMKSMLLHRSNLRSLYRGDVCHIYSRHKAVEPSRGGVVCWMGLVGYQGALYSLGIVLQTVVFFICFIFLVFLLIVPVFHGRNLLVFQVAAQSWPAWVTLILVTILQHVMAKFAFVKKEAGTSDINNRDSLFLLTYLLFLVNFVLGLLVAMWRTLISAVYNLVHMGRTDLSLLHRSSEDYDPAYRFYTQFLAVEVSQAHPVMKAFCGVLLDLIMEGGRAVHKIQQVEEGLQENRPNAALLSRRIRRRWQLVFTLVNNPSLLGSRKHFQTQPSETAASAANGTPTTKTGSRNSQAGSRKDKKEPELGLAVEAEIEEQ
ncbi:receptor for retinol uptake stra6-like [Eucyclogobius newberryi]|uniref:receptor for retinol uptake stra6-like n=1 Tax=Eucyclogobius newberryi TaxID=166745 RepID=UPI003B5C83BD